jgi:GNAT superfamily N-acetyltransferase
VTKIFDYLRRTPWDQRAFGFDTFEVKQLSEDILQQLKTVPGHYTVKMSPLAPKDLLHKYGFYYCDSLLEPYCTREHFLFHHRDHIAISRHEPLEELLKICNGAFVHGRFHRDFHIDKHLADARYNNWLRDLYEAGNCFALLERDVLAGFLAFDKSKMVLHAVSEEYRGKGLAKYFWSVACDELFRTGYNELSSSVSATNVAVVNLYATLGFRFRNPCDVYHLMVKAETKTQGTSL